MEFVAMTKTGVQIYDVLAPKPEGLDDGDEGAAKQGVEPVASLPAATNAEGYVSTNAEGFAWSADGSLLVTVDKGMAVIWDANKGYERVAELPIAGNSGGARALRFSPGGSYLSTYEKYDKEKCPENVQVFDVRELPDFGRLRVMTLKGYSSGAVPVDVIQWPQDESTCLELVPGEGLVVLDEFLKVVEPKQVVPEPNTSSFQLAPCPHGGACYVACYVPEAPGRTAEVAVYHLSDTDDATTRIQLPKKLKTVTMHWNFDGSALLVLASSDVDETGQSYFGTTSLFWLRADGKGKQQITGAEDGLVQDVAWSPTASEFLLIVGMMPATVSLYDGKNGKQLSTFGKSRRNTIRWSPFGRLLVVGGFGALPGDLEFFDRTTEETIVSFRAALTVNCCWAPDGRHFLACTTAPRMNEDNQVSIFKYTGERVLRVDFKPKPGEGSHRMALARADAGAMLFASSWRPCNKGKFEDRPPTPGRGPRRIKGLPSEGPGIQGAAPSKAAAYRPAAARGGGSSVAAMMRGEVPLTDHSAEAPGRSTERWGETVSGQMSADELRAKLKEQKEAEKKAKLAEEEAARLAKEAERAAHKQLEERDRKLAKLKKELAQLQELKEKPWDELTEEDEKQLEGELELRELIQQLENAKSRSG